MAFELKYDESSLSNGLDKMGAKMGALVLMYTSTKSKELQSKMKMNRPWTDRTGMAKALLTVRVSQPSPQTVRMTFAHGVDYGIWLELANEKNYAIIGPTIREEAPRVVEGLRGIMQRLKV